MRTTSPNPITTNINNIAPNKSKTQPKTVKNNLIDKIIKLDDQSGIPYMQKFEIDSILTNIQKHQIEIVELFSKYLKEGFNLLQFVRFFLNIIPHNHIENLYLAIGLIQLFREITIQTHKDKICLKDITDFMCDKILKNDRSFNKIEAKFLPFSKFITPSSKNKLFLQQPPSIYGQTDQKIHKLCQKCIKTDSTKHSRAIIRSQFSYDLKKVFILDSLTQSISVYDQNCNLIKKISPILTKLKKQVIILSFAFSRRQYRIGAVLKDFSIKFWDHFNDFQYQKSISTTSICQNLQTNIYFLEYFNNWITTDKTGTIHFWNLLEQKPDRNLKCKYQSNINDICQIPALNLIAIVQECKRSNKLTQNQQKQRWQNGVSDSTVVIYNYYNGHIITQIDLIGQRIPHTIVYSETYQVLFMSGLEKKIKIYDLHPKYMDASLRGQLIGHQNLITCFTLIRNTPMLVSADDKGKVKLWDFRNYICLQTIDFSDKTIITNLLDMIQIGKFGVFGSRVNYIQFQQKYDIIKKRCQEETLKIQNIDFDSNLMEMFVFANKSLRVIDLYKGQMKHIFSFKNTPSDEQFTIFRYFSCQKKFVLGSSKGEISIFNPQIGQLQSILKQNHEGAINFIEFDQLNKLYVSVGYDSKILVHRCSDGNMIRQLKNNFNGKEISCIEMSVYHNLLIIGSNSSSCLYLWNYQYCKLIGEIQLSNEFPLSLHIINGYGLLLVGTNAHNIYLFRTNISNNDLQIELLEKISISHNIISISTDVKLKGKGKYTQCQQGKVLICCQNGQYLEYNIVNFIKTQNFKIHCKEKSNYNPYREGKQNFISEIQKMKHKIFIVPENIENILEQTIFQQQVSVFTQFNSINLFKLIKLEQTLKIIIGNDRRIKIMNQSHQLLCDFNINYCLPYKWELKPTSTAITTQKIYYGIKVLETILKKYQNDISIGQAKNIEMKELFQFIQKKEADSLKNSKFKMITEPGELSEILSDEKPKNITLLQNQYSRKDLNFELIKRFNFTEIAGPTLKELDNIKKIDILQREWKVKQYKEQKQKDSLLKNIEIKAKKNEEKDQIQFLFVKQKKITPKEIKIQGEKLNGLIKKLQQIENKPSSSSEDKKCMTTFYKNIYNRFAIKLQNDGNSYLDQKLVNYHSQTKLKKSFEKYYEQKFKKDDFIEFKNKKQTNIKFRDILTQMNGRVNTIKKFRYRRNKQKAIYQE